MITVDDERIEYVRNVANHFFPTITSESFPHRIVNMPSKVPEVFCNAVNEGTIDISQSEAFVNDTSLREMIGARHIDPEKLWILCVWGKHLLMNSVEVLGGPPPREVSSFSSALQKISEDDDVEISLTVGGEKVFSIKRFPVAAFLCEIINRGLKCHYEELLDTSYVESYPERAMTNKAISYFFYRYLSFILKDKKPIERIELAETKDTKFFIGKLLFAVGLSNDVRLNEYWTSPVDKNALASPRQFFNGILSGSEKDFKQRKVWSQPYREWLK